MFDEAADDPAHVLLGVSQGLDNVGDASVGFDHRPFLRKHPKTPQLIVSKCVKIAYPAAPTKGLEP
jgi:hypothetical protein